jgi:hypothetical protein
MAGDVIIAPRRRRNRRHDALIIGALAVLAVIMALAWLAKHLAVLAGVALLIAGAYCAARHGRRRARPGQVRLPSGQPEEPAAAPAVPAVTLPQSDYDWGEPGTRQPASPPAGPDRDKLLADPRSRARPVWGPE